MGLDSNDTSNCIGKLKGSMRLEQVILKDKQSGHEFLRNRGTTMEACSGAICPT